jgi:hypothetical protein
VAIGADEDAFLCLLTESPKRLSNPHVHVERLRRGIHVVKVQIQLTAVIATDCAAAACFIDQNGANTTVPTGHGLADASLAPVDKATGAAIAMKRDQTVPRALAKDRCAGWIRRPACNASWYWLVHERMFARAADGKVRLLGIEPRPPV